ncbi:LuxR C-terminal-related transcriptional regulator [Amycolatopsis sp. MtRt-6]|uniref:LuxR C-terminal-related transcriptional regulator n=1 Tax=Amycolatopsis sp. MtRt-6 TaxID=2792782 RepID=UPI001A8F511D|nr:LuxR C-terminal-related transcriptional regulator [Amycolatopsis sp. MtRt-6]
MRRPGRAWLTVVAGPAGFEGDPVAAAVCRRWHETPDGGGATFTVAFDPDVTELPLPAPAVLRCRPGSVLCLKDVHLLRPAAFGALEAAVRQLAGPGTACVATVSLPVAAAARPEIGRVFARLRDDGLARLAVVRPLSRAQFEAELTTVLDAKPEPALLTRHRALSRGWPAAAAEAGRIADEHDMIRLVDKHAFLRPGHGYPRLSESDEVVRRLRRLGEETWRAAKAVAVLGPLGEALPALLATAVGVSEADAQDLLARLRDAGALHHHRVAAEWRFRIPLVGAALRAALGPYERRLLAKIAVEALWRGAARCADPGYLPDQIAYAGKLIDPVRAREELLKHAERTASAPSFETIAWLRAAAGLTVDPAERSRLLYRHTLVCLFHGCAHLALESSTLVVETLPAGFTEEERVDALFIHMMTLFGAEDLGTLARIARGELWPWSGGPAERGACRAFALFLLGRWRETHDLLQRLRQAPGAEVIARHIGYLGPIADLWLGHSGEFRRDVATLPARAAEGGPAAVAEVLSRTEALLVLGEAETAERLLAATPRVPVPVSVPAQMATAFHRGEFDLALELACKSIATSSPHGCDAPQSTMFQLAALVQMARGKLVRARELLATAQARHPAFPHALALPEAWLDAVFADFERSRSVLRAALDRADEEGVVVHTDALWIALADLAVSRGIDAHLLPEYLRRLERAATRLGTGSAEIHHLTLRAFVESDTRAAAAALHLLDRRGQPFEQALGWERLARYGVAGPETLSLAYERYGSIDALIRRSRLRKKMQRQGIPVPGRQATVAENERLLAVLVCEGLTNKQIAVVLGASGKSVEGRLSRLFTRTGYQSRVELATAMLTGRFEAGG